MLAACGGAEKGAGAEVCSIPCIICCSISSSVRTCGRAGGAVGAGTGAEIDTPDISASISSRVLICPGGGGPDCGRDGGCARAGLTTVRELKEGVYQCSVWYSGLT